MNLITWFDAVPGRQQRMAEHFGRTKGAVSQWRTNGVPVALMKAVREFTDGAVTLEEMVPDMHTDEVVGSTVTLAVPVDFVEEQ